MKEQRLVQSWVVFTLTVCLFEQYGLAQESFDIPPPQLCRVWMEEDVIHYEVPVPYTETVTQSYTVAVPYVEELEDGSTVQRTRQETRTREVAVTRMQTETRVVDIESIDFSTKSGQPVTGIDRLKTALKKPRPGLIIFGDKSLPKFYQQFFSDNVVVMSFKPEEWNANPSVPETAEPIPSAEPFGVVSPPTADDDGNREAP